MRSNPEVNISKEDYDGAIFDLDGVITRTAGVHSEAWKELFDQYLAERSRSRKEEMVPFDRAVDYPRYVDGKPRYKGVKSFLDSRGIKLPWGSPDDSPERETICGLGNRKNQIFHRLLEERGVEVYEAAANLLRTMRESGMKVAVVSSSKNCRAVLKAARLTHLFDVSVDGLSVEEMDLKGKPDPDMFLEAASRLGVPPSRTVVFEDALAGVQAAKAGGFRCVVGVDRAQHAEDLRRAGADFVIEHFHQIFLIDESGQRLLIPAGSLPSALDRVEEIAKQARASQIALFLDYDGTLTEIVDDPGRAVLSQEMRETLSKLSDLLPVAVVSGRGLTDVRKMVGLKGIFYAGSHGFEIQGPDGVLHEQATDYLPTLDQAEKELELGVCEIQGARVERKKFSIAVHFRQTPERHIDRVEEIVGRTVARHPELRKSAGKKVFEVQPAIEWDKGRAVNRLVELLGLDREKIVPLYIGDDTTDEDAFSALRGWGVTVAVDSGQRTAAMYKVDNPREVRRLLESLRGVLKGKT